MHFIKSLVLSLVVTFNITVQAANNKSQVVRIGSGNILEGYYFIGLKLCEFIKNSNKDVKCEVIPTNGSFENLQMIRQGRLDFALVQGNIALDAYKGEGYFTGLEPMDHLRQLLTLHDEVFTVIVKDEDKIRLFGDLEGKKISNGHPVSDSTITYEALRKFYDFKKEPQDIEVAQEDYYKEFCNGNIDVLLMMTGHPNAFVSQFAYNCEIDFVSIESNKIEELINSNPAFHKVILPKDLYPGITDDQTTVGVSAILVTTTKMNNNLLKNLLTYLNENILQFKLSHPVLSGLSNEHFFSGSTLPNHIVIKEIME